MEKQKTLANEITFCGIGVHSGKEARVTLLPAAVGTGIRISCSHVPDCQMVIGNVIPENALHATVLKHNGVVISTIEHLLATLSALGIDNVFVVVHGQEIPIIDGSALPFVQGIMGVGIKVQDAKKQFLTPKHLLRFDDEHGRLLEVEPAGVDENGLQDTLLHINYKAEFKNGVEGAEEFLGSITPDFFIRQIAPARTFGFVEQLPFLRQHGLALGTSLGNTVVIGQDGLFNDMRLPDECVRHKVLDLIGDLALLGTSLAGKVRACKTGHNFNHRVIEHYIHHPEWWSVF